MWKLSKGMATYQLGPFEDEKFVPSRVDEIVKRTVDAFASNMVNVTNLKDVSDEVAVKVKTAVVAEGKMPRHRISVQSFVTRDEGQPLFVGSKALWDSNVDNYSSYVHKTKDGYVICVIVFCVYKE
jgi:hypothetical protein